MGSSQPKARSWQVSGDLALGPLGKRAPGDGGPLWPLVDGGLFVNPRSRGCHRGELRQPAGF